MAPAPSSSRVVDHRAAALAWRHGVAHRGQPARPGDRAAALVHAAGRVVGGLRRPAPPRPEPPHRPHRPPPRPHLRRQGDAGGDRVPRVPPAARPPSPRPAGGPARRRGHRARDGRRRGAAVGVDDRAPRVLPALPRHCSPTGCRPTACRAWSTRWSCCWSGCTWPTSTGATSRCPTCCSVAAPAGSRRTSSTPRPASCDRPCRRQMREYDVQVGVRERLRRAARPPGRPAGSAPMWRGTRSWR